MPGPCSFALRGAPPPSSASHRYPLLLRQVEGSFLRSSLGDSNPSPPTLSKPPPILDKPAPRVRHGRQAWGQVSPHCEPPLPPMSPVFPLCRGFCRVLCHKLHKDFSQTTIQGVLSCRVGGHSCLPCRGSCCGQNIWELGDTCSIIWLSVPPSPFLGPGKLTPEGSVAKPGTFLRAQDSLLGPPRPKEVAGRGRSPQSTPSQATGQSTMAWVGPGRPACLPPTPQQGQHFALAPPALLTTPSFSAGPTTRPPMKGTWWEGDRGHQGMP